MTPGEPVSTIISIRVPLRPGRGQNERFQWKTRQRTTKRERGAVIWAFVRHRLDGGAQIPPPPYDVRLVRVYPAKGARELDDDNWVGAAKAIRDQVADELKVNDGDRSKVRFFYAQESGEDFYVRVEIAPMGTLAAAPAQAPAPVPAPAPRRTRPARASAPLLPGFDR